LIKRPTDVGSTVLFLQAGKSRNGSPGPGNETGKILKFNRSHLHAGFFTTIDHKFTEFFRTWARLLRTSQGPRVLLEWWQGRLLGSIF